MSSESKLARLRKEFTKYNIEAYIIPSEDAHQSEYIAAVDARRGFACKEYSIKFKFFFFVIVTSLTLLAPAALQWLLRTQQLCGPTEASKQLDENWILQKSGEKGVPTREEWLNKVLPKNSKVGLDPKLISVAAATTLTKNFEKSNHTLVSIEENLVDVVWENDKKPALPDNCVEILDVKYSGRDFKEKMAELRSTFDEENVWGCAVTALDEIAWLFNLRGSDIIYNPVFFAYALITKDTAKLYINKNKLTKDVIDYLGSSVTILPYNQIFLDLQSSQFEDKKLLIDSRWLENLIIFVNFFIVLSNLALQNAIGGPKYVKVASVSAVMNSKAIKNKIELEGIRQSHIRDASALCNYFAWLENELLVKKNNSLSEYDAAVKLEEFRRELKDFVGLSFDTISSTGPNGAIIHYKPQKDTCAIIKVDQLYLCDSGAQFKYALSLFVLIIILKYVNRDGTTDVTRTLHFGTPTQHEIDCFTRVLKGHIQLDLAVFPSGTLGSTLDVLARTALWKVGLNYRHGTGHGVGHYLNVHEGPQGIGLKPSCELKAGMTVTNEPGYYEDGNFGIRIENVLIIEEKNTEFNFGATGFEHVTFVPIQKKLINFELLTTEETEWVKNYNLKCFGKVKDHLKEGSLGYLWLERETKP
ncbi:hypothetical protein HK099_003339 [Clydaea vesicula]|uniref:Metallopeptidase M24 family protein n=1 Tax=Clydaea vesicula TaxID=447962 RepID=A0AAD5UA70_9FUNG|nr:hypothetical protein HK099_003339 [Clydaea vesicula]